MKTSAVRRATDAARRRHGAGRAGAGGEPERKTDGEPVSKLNNETNVDPVSKLNNETSVEPEREPNDETSVGPEREPDGRPVSEPDKIIHPRFAMRPFPCASCPDIGGLLSPGRRDGGDDPRVLVGDAL